jgi:ABC-2 type transport system permease protein
VTLASAAAAVAIKELRHIRRDRFSLVLIVGLPVFQLILFGYALNLSTPEAPAAVCNLDSGSESRSLVRSFEASGMFRVVRFVSDDRQLADALIAGHAKVGIYIPRGFTADVVSGRSASVAVWIDGSEAAVAAQSQMASNAIAGHRIIQQIAPILNSERRLPIEIRVRMLFNPSSRSANFLIPGLIGILLQMITTLLIATSIVREREKGTLNQVLLTPIGLRGMAAGKLLAYTLLGFAEGAVLLALMRFVFRVPIHGSVPLLLVLLLLFLAPSLAIGLLIAARARRQAHALQLTYLVFLPSVMLSGYLFPRASMPGPIRLVSALLPATYSVDILRAIIIRGAPLGAIARDALVLSVLATVLMAGAIRAFTRRVGSF